MASNSILKLQVDDKQYEASLKSAQQGLQALMNALRNSGKSFSDLDKNTTQYVRALGNMETTAKTTRGRIGEMSSAFVELSQVEKQLTDQERQSPVGKALTESLNQLKQRTIEAKQELADLDKQLTSQKAPDIAEGVKAGGLFGGGKLDGMLQVFGGNVMTKVAGMATGLVTEMGDAVKQGIELARQGEGIRIAFERLGRGDILDGLREATHGTVTDLELMKAAVKFNDFKLPVEELGTMLAFAQQKAKDTGQSVDYMVDSIVTGLGRKSLMILDNLGLSANEIKEKMKQTGDMTKAVGAIIRDQMAAAGDYVETAADRAAQANVSLQNKMEELGRKFSPVEEASNQLWTSIKIGILDIVGGPLAELLNGLTEAGRLQNAINNMNGGGNGGPTRIDRMVSMLGDGKGAKSRNTYNKQLGVFDERINQQQFRIASLSGNDAITRGLRQKAETELKALEAMRAEYISRANDVFNPKSTTPLNPTTDPKKGAKEEKDDFTEIIGLIGMAQEHVSDLQRQISESWDEGEIAKLTEELKAAEKELQRLKDIGKENPMAMGLSGFNQQTMSAWMQGRQGDLSKAEFGSADYGNIMANIADMNTIKTIIEQSMMAGVDSAQFDLSSMWEKVFDGENIPDNVWQGMIDVINEKLEELELQPIKLDFKTGNINKLEKDSKDLAKDWREAGTAISAVSSAMSSIEDPAAKVVGTIAQAVAAVALGASQAIALAGNGSAGGPWGWIAFAAAATATMISTIATIHSATGYAQGGIVDGRGGGFVGGTSYSGDNIGNVRLDSGELVLNRAQQNNLAGALEDNNLGNLGLSVKVTAEELRFILGNNSRRRGKGEYVTTTRLR